MLFVVQTIYLSQNNVESLYKLYMILLWFRIKIIEVYNIFFFLIIIPNAKIINMSLLYIK